MAKEPSYRAALLARCQLFDGLSLDELTAVSEAFRLRRYSRGQVIFLQGQRAELACIVASGSVKLAQETPDGHEVILRIAQPGEAFGVVAAIIDDLYPLTAIAQEDATVLCCPASRLRLLVEQFPSINRKALQLVSERLREAFARIREMSLERVDRRIARSLLRLVDNAVRVDPSTNPVLRLSRQDLAEMAGTTLATASRTVAKLHRMGIVRAGRQNIAIIDRERLEAMADERVSYPEAYRHPAGIAL